MRAGEAVSTRARAVLDLAARARGSALVNASTAVAAVSQQIADRARLAPGPADGEVGDPVAGGITRLDRDSCLQLLEGRTVGRLAYVARAGTPDIVPVNYTVHQGDVLLCSGAGPKLQAADRGEVVAFEVDEVDEVTRRGWSVVAVGRASRLTFAEHRAVPVEALPRPWANGPRNQIIRVRTTRLEGRRLW